MAFWLWIVLAIVLAGIVAALFSRVRVRVRYSRSGRLDQLVIVIQALYGLFHYQIILPSIVIRGWSVVYRDKREGGLSGIGTNNEKQNKRKIGKGSLLRYARSYRTILLSTKNFRRWARRTMKKVECTRWRLDFRAGTGEAASTAVVTGLLWAITGFASGAAGQLITLKTSPHGNVVPNYATTEFSVVWEADFRIRVGTALAAGIKLGKNTIHLRKALRAWRIFISGPNETLS